jgi:hypothetical protein
LLPVRFPLAESRDESRAATGQARSRDSCRFHVGKIIGQRSSSAWLGKRPSEGPKSTPHRRRLATPDEIRAAIANILSIGNVLDTCAATCCAVATSGVSGRAIDKIDTDAIRQIATASGIERRVVQRPFVAVRHWFMARGFN